MLIHGMLERAQIEVLTADPTGADLVVGRLWYRSDTLRFKVYDGTAVQEFVDLVGAQTLQNKILASPQVTGFADVQEVASPATPASGFSRVYAKNDGKLYKKDDAGREIQVIEGDTQGSVIFPEIASTPTTPVSGEKKVYAKNDGKMYTLNSLGEEVELGAGAGDGEKNFVTNGKAEENTTGWATYQDVAGTRPVDGTGGSAVGVTFTRSTTSPLDGDASFIFTKDAANRQGEGASTVLDIPLAYRAKVLTIEADYIVNSGTFVAGTNATDSDVICYIFDVTNSHLIEPSSFKFLSNSTTISDKFQATFQTSATGAQYRLILHVATTSAAAYSLKIDNVKVSPSRYVYGTPITDWQSFTPTWGSNGTQPSLGNGSLAGRYRRVGDSAEIQISLLAGSTTSFGTGIYNFGFASVGTIDAAKYIASSQTTKNTANFFDSSSGTIYSAAPFTNAPSSAMTMRVWITSGSFATHADAGATVPVTWATSDSAYLEFSVPIQGWSSSVQTSDSTDTRVVAAKVSSGTASGAASQGTFSFTSQTVAHDTHGAWSTGTNLYTVPVSGLYRIGIQITNPTFSSANGTIQAKINGSTSGSVARSILTWSSTNYQVPFSYTTLQLNAGDTVGFSSDNGLTSCSWTNISFERISGPSAIAASESVAFRAKTGAGQSIPNNTETTLIFGSVDVDTHGAYNSTTGIYTIPTSGVYSLNSVVTFGINANGTRIAYFKAATPSLIYVGAAGSFAPSGSVRSSSSGSTIYRFKAGDQVSMTVFQNSGGSLAMFNNDTENYFSIHRIGL